MRKLIFIFLTIFQCYSVAVKAQTFVPTSEILEKYGVLDTCMYKVYYDFTLYPDSGSRGAVIKDIHLLEIGKNVSKCHSYLLFQKDSITTEMVAQGLDTGFLIQQQIWPVETHFLFDTHRIVFLCRAFFGSIFEYTEPMENINWKIEEDMDSIASYLCQKATCWFRGRTYNAWFATDIPLSVGPYKFHGLPGLILKISDEDNQYNWVCSGFEKAKPGETIKDYRWKREKMSRKKVEAIMIRMYNTPYQFCESMGVKFRVRRSNGEYGARGKDIPLPYSPIEKTK